MVTEAAARRSTPAGVRMYRRGCKEVRPRANIRTAAGVSSGEGGGGALSLSHLFLIFATMNRLLRCWTWLRRIRHRRGYGIHSPFAFALVTGVIYERGAYYAYEALRRERRRRRVRGDERDDRLLLRLANDFQPRRALLWTTADDMAPAYLLAGCRQGAYRRVRRTEDLTACDFFYIDDADRLPDVLPALLPLLEERALVVVRRLRKKRVRTAWRRFTSDARIRVTFDLCDIGLAYTERRLNKQDYTINY